MNAWKAKRFWKGTSVVELPTGFSVKLDERDVKTPAKADLILPTYAMAKAIAREWDAQQEEIDPHSMPVTRAANAAIDKVSQQQKEVTDIVAAYADADLLCYRAVGPISLIERQNQAWDPLLDWAEDTFGVRLQLVEGVMHAAQNQEELKKLTADVHKMDAFALTAFHELVSLSGSFVIGLATIYKRNPPQELWQIARVDEIWQNEQWGEDEEAQEAARYKESEFVQATQFYDYSTSDPLKRPN